ncbi:MAG: DUF1553 domain-containing protein [Planctomycetes bacterium]|nr:DUF1553 domain-containing protein [Planctomycetota bacterium]
MSKRHQADRRGFAVRATTAFGFCALLLGAVLFNGVGFVVQAAEEPAAPPANPPVVQAQENTSPEALAQAERFFESKIRPALHEHCLKCHGAEKQKGGLRLDTLGAMLTGGDSGAAIVPGDVAHSPLIQAIEYGEDFVQMPPSKKLPEGVIADFRTWIKLGAPWPGAEKEAAAARPQPKSKDITDEDRKYWAYQPVRQPKLPKSARAGWDTNPIDMLIDARLQAKGLAPNPRASKVQLIRRAYFDLIGLPPTPEEVAKFVADESPGAFARVIDDLLARPQYGERWARHWLDVVRYAQSNGYERDSEKPFAWRYRDYVIRSLNADKPYHQFLLEQLAGDELDEVTDDSLIATGYYRLGVWDDEPDDARMAEFDALDDVIVTTGAAMLGMTVGCARCHDHRLDPIPQTDYYRLLAFFRNVRPFDGNRATEGASGFLPLGDRERAAQHFAAVNERIKPLEEQIKTANEKTKKALRKEIDRLRNDAGAKVEWALCVRERGDQPTHVLIRGNSGSPGEEVQPGFPTVLGSATPEISKPKSGASSGRRLALARWITDPSHPLTARVMANRVWHYHFGRGIVKTTTDFGHGGQLPTHPELLDWLASEFQQSGWSIKRLHRSIMLSEAYQMSSRADRADALAADPANDLFWRQNLRRLEAETIRDSILAVSGQLKDVPGGRGFFPHLGGEVLAGGSRPGDGWATSTPREQSRRSIYAFIKRSMVPPIFEGFDYANTAAPLGERPTTTVAPQALMLLNDRFVQDQATALARRIVESKPDTASNDPDVQIQRLFQLTLNRAPTERERQAALEYLDRQTGAYALLESRLTFAPDVPLSLHRSYLDKLQPADILIGPRQGWNFYRGRWTGGYEGIMTVERQRGPFALWLGPAFADGTITANVTLQNAVEFGSLIFRAAAEGEVFRGYEVELNAREQSIALRRHGADVTLLANVDAVLPVGKPMPVKIEVRGAQIRVFVAHEREPLVEVTDPQPLRDSGRLGARSWGAAMHLDNLKVHADGRVLDVARMTPAAEAGAPSTTPPAGWRLYGGRWQLHDDSYTAEPSPGAKAVWDGGPLADGVIEADFKLLAPGGDAGLVLRVSQPTDGVDALNAYNINFQPGALRLGKHRNNWKQLVRVPLDLGVDRWHHVRVDLAGDRIKITIDRAEKPQIDYTDEQPLPPGNVGLRTMNAKFVTKNLTVTAGGKTTLAEFKPTKTEPVAVVAGPTPRERALASLCLLMFNLNEFVYVD